MDATFLARLLRPYWMLDIPQPVPASTMRSVVTAAGHTIQDEGTPLTTRTNLNFVGAGVTATDDSGNNATKITIPGGSGGAHKTPMRISCMGYSLSDTAITWGNIVAQGDLIFILDAAPNSTDGLFTILSVANPYSPVVLSQTLITSASTTVGHLQVAGKYAYITLNGDAKLRIYDISDPHNPSLTSSTSITSPGAMFELVAVGASSYVVYAGADAKVYIYNVTNPASVAVTSNGTLNLTSSSDYCAYCNGVFYSTYNNTRIDLVDLSTIGTPSLITSISGSDTLYGPMQATINRLYVGTQTGTNGSKMRIFDVSTPASPSLLASIANDDTGNVSAYGLSTDGHYVYLANAGTNNSFTIFDVEDGSTPSQVGRCAINNDNSPNNGLALIGNRAYIRLNSTSDINMEVVGF